MPKKPVTSSNPAGRRIDPKGGKEARPVSHMPPHVVEPFEAILVLSIGDDHQLRGARSVEKALLSRFLDRESSRHVLSFPGVAAGEPGRFQPLPNPPRRRVASSIGGQGLRKIVVNPPAILPGARIEAYGQKSAAWSKYAPGFPNERHRIAEVMQGVDAENPRKRSVAKGQRFGSRANEMHVWEC